MTLIDGDKIITTQLYDDEHEEYTENKMSIIDFVNAYSDEGVTTADDVLDKIRAEIEQLHLIGYATVDGKREIANRAVLQIIDKYKAESEPKESEEKK